MHYYTVVRLPIQDPSPGPSMLSALHAFGSTILSFFTTAMLPGFFRHLPHPHGKAFLSASQKKWRSAVLNLINILACSTSKLLSIFMRSFFPCPKLTCSAHFYLTSFKTLLYMLNILFLFFNSSLSVPTISP